MNKHLDLETRLKEFYSMSLSRSLASGLTPNYSSFTAPGLVPGWTSWLGSQAPDKYCLDLQSYPSSPLSPFLLPYTANIYSHIVIWIYQIHEENVYIDDRQTFL